MEIWDVVAGMLLVASVAWLGLTLLVLGALACSGVRRLRSPSSLDATELPRDARRAHVA